MAIKDGYKAVNIQLDEKVLEWVGKIAARNYRSVAGQIRWFLEDAKLQIKKEVK